MSAAPIYTPLDVTETAFAAHDAGLCVLPPAHDGSKKPYAEFVTRDGLTTRFGADVAKELLGDRESGWTWKHFQIERLDRDGLWKLYQPGRDGVGVVCGKVSNNLELTEFDELHTYHEFKHAADGIGLGDVVARIEAGYLEETPGGGVHWLYYCDEIAGNTELARRPGPPDEHGNPTITVLIETRGNGGYVVMAPSGGRVHPSGNTYQLLAGDVATIATITPAERAALHQLARDFDAMPVKDASPPPRSATPRGADLQPGDDFNQRADWLHDVLGPHGFDRLYQRGERVYWRRPGKPSNEPGHSGVTNYDGADRLVVYSTSTVLPANEGLSKFRAYTFLNHAGDFSAAAKELASKGYGSKTPPTTAITAHLNGNGHAHAAVPPSEPAGGEPPRQLPEGVTPTDFHAYMPEHKYIFVPNGELWPASSVNARLGRIAGGEKSLPAATWLDQNRPVEQMTWAPGEPTLIEGRLVDHGGWIYRPGLTSFNLYRPPTLKLGNPNAAGRWVEHVHRVYPSEADHIIAWLAHRVQHPGVKINHALVLGGQQGIGKDTLLEPVRYAIGPWNMQEISPVQLLGRFNGFVKSVLLRVSEARDLGDVDRYGFYEHLKVYTASPPDVLRCDEKHTREYSVMNVCGVVITTNHKTDGIYLPADDRRHFVAWSDLSMADFDSDYWNSLYTWFAAEGYSNVAAYLHALDISDFDPKSPPPKTPAFWDIVDANRAPEDAELADALESLMYPQATTLDAIAVAASGINPDFSVWIRERKNRRQIPHRLEAAGYVPVRNEGTSDGRWKVNGQNQVVYARRELSVRDRIIAAQRLRGR